MIQQETALSPDGRFAYQTEQGRAVVTQYLGGEENVLRLPETLGGLPLREIGESAFSEAGGALEEIVVPGSVRLVGAAAFEYCFSLRRLVLEEGVERLGAGFAASCPLLTALTLPASLRQIDRPSDLGALTLTLAPGNPLFLHDGYGLYRREGAETQGQAASAESALTQGQAISAELSSTQGQDLPAENVSEHTRILSAEKADAQTFVSSGFPLSLLTVSLQDQRASYRVAAGTRTIGARAFAGQSWLRRLTLPDSVRSIGEGAFRQCDSLAEVALNEGLREIGDEAFAACPALQTLTLPSTLRALGRSALDTNSWDDRTGGLERIFLREAEDDGAATAAAVDTRCANTPAADADNLSVTSAAPLVDGTQKSASPFFLKDSALFFMTELVKYFGADADYTVPPFVTRVRECAFRRTPLRELTVCGDTVFWEQDALKGCAAIEKLTFSVNNEVISSLYIPPLVYRKEEFYRLLYCGPLDYAGYDRLFPTYYTEPFDMMMMACCRLRYPVELPAAQEQEYRGYLSRNLSALLAAIAERDAPQALRELSAFGLFTAGNIDECIDFFNRKRKPILLQTLLQYKHEQLGETAFSFEL